MNARSDGLPIGALSKQTGCNIETIRYYEKAGLLPTPARSPAGYRRYGSTHLKRLIFIPPRPGARLFHRRGPEAPQARR
jgi:MerR family regulatory protein